MTLVKFNNRPYSKTFNNVFDELLHEFPVWGRELNTAAPVNITETPTAFQVTLNVPGRNKEDFKVSIDNGLLTVSYEKKEEVKSETDKAIRKEFTFQNFKRSFTLDETVDTEKIEARYENGLLNFNLPKKETVKEPTKQISIQ